MGELEYGDWEADRLPRLVFQRAGQRPTGRANQPRRPIKFGWQRRRHEGGIAALRYALAGNGSYLRHKPFFRVENSILRYFHNQS